MKKKVAIWGAGPSGMMAAHAVSEMGHEIKIYDKDPDMTRRNAGVFYLHSDCNLGLEPIRIKHRVLGGIHFSDADLASAYGAKVYGDPMLKKNSIVGARRIAEVTGYNAQQAVSRLWDIYGDFVEREEIRNFDRDYSLFSQEHDLIVSTIPAYALFPDADLKATSTWIGIGEAPSEENFILYDINPQIPWYRCSAIAGVFVMEFGKNYVPKLPSELKYQQVTKVMSDVSPLKKFPNLLFTGRFGAWDKTILTHNVYFNVLDWLFEMEQTSDG